MNLKDFFTEYPRIAIAFSGGTDSAYLLYAAKKYSAAARAYFVKSEFQPDFELDGALKAAKELNADIKIIRLEALAVPFVKENPPERCYYCKKAVFSAILKEANKDGFTVLADGTNASDDESDRPGTRAIRELKVLSPLKMCGLTKDMVRSLSRKAGLSTYNKPSYSCLATRIAAGEEITKEKLSATENAEGFLFSLGFSDFRIRQKNGEAKLQLTANDLPLLLKNREKILVFLKKYYKNAVLDLEVR